MGLRDFRIVLDNEWSTYYPGQSLSGRVMLVLDGIKKIRGIQVKIKGEGNTCWATDRQELNHEGRYENESQTVTGHEEYFSMQYYIIGTATGDQVELATGEHSYPFTCVLPPNLPSSFEHALGHVRYTIKAIIDRPWKFDHECKVAFTVVSNFDLNKEVRAAEPMELEMSKTFCCLCCGSAPLEMTVRLPIKGFVPGQSMPFHVNVENKSGIVVDTVKLILRKNVTFRANRPRVDLRKDSIVVAEVSRGPVEGNATTDYEQKIEIPPLPPSNLSHCGIIDLEYNVKVEACVSGWYHRNLKKNTCVFIGTVPLIIPAAAAAHDPGYVLPSAPEAPAAIGYPDAPMPTFEEAGWSVRSLRDADESDHVMGIQGHFAPRYPVYRFAS